MKQYLFTHPTGKHEGQQKQQAGSRNTKDICCYDHRTEHILMKQIKPSKRLSKHKKPKEYYKTKMITVTQI